MWSSAPSVAFWCTSLCILFFFSNVDAASLSPAWGLEQDHVRCCVSLLRVFACSVVALTSAGKLDALWQKDPRTVRVCLRFPPTSLGSKNRDSIADDGVHLHSTRLHIGAVEVAIYLPPGPQLETATMHLLHQHRTRVAEFGRRRRV